MSKPEEIKEESKAPAVTVKTEEERDVEELREIFKILGEFMKELPPILKELIETVLSTLRGDVIGKEVGAFYKSLVEAGMKEEMVARMTEEFLRARMEAVNIASILSKLIESEAIEKEKKISKEKSG
jgi:hypothetical protein